MIGTSVMKEFMWYILSGKSLRDFMQSDIVIMCDLIIVFEVFHPVILVHPCYPWNKWRITLNIEIETLNYCCGYSLFYEFVLKSFEMHFKLLLKVKKNLIFDEVRCTFTEECLLIQTGNNSFTVFEGALDLIFTVILKIEV